MAENNMMFCNQCEQTANGHGCCVRGVCGKTPDLQSLQEILIYGLKGLAAYAHHARRLGKVDEAVDTFVEEALFSTLTNVNFDATVMQELVHECGMQNLRAMEMLDAGHNEVFGKPQPADVREGLLPGPAILVTGHDMLDLKHLLELAETAKVNVYTHGEMLPAHAYPELKKYKSLAGHYGTAWQNQEAEFAAFPGPILVTTNCIFPPKGTPEYLKRMYTLRFVAMAGTHRIKGDNLMPLIEHALNCQPATATETKISQVGFHWRTLLDLAPIIVDSVKQGLISRFFVIGGCDGAKPGRNWFTDFAKAAPPNSIILTCGCGKFRIRNNDYGTITLSNGVKVPRLLDMGQCNDSFGAIQVALALSKAFNCGVNDLPLTIALSWFEQKAVAVLLTLLALNVKGIILGPSLPAFITPAIYQALVAAYDLKPIGKDAVADMQAIMK